MRKIFILVLLTQVSIHNLIAQNSLSGTVRDELTGKPIEGGSVYIQDLNKGSITDTAGNFSIKNIPSGKYLVEISHLGFGVQTSLIEIKGTTRLDFDLKESVIEIEPVVITDVSNSNMVINSPLPVSRVSRDALLQTSATNIVDAISKQPGVSQLSTGAAISKPVIRGLTHSRVITLYNGVRQEGQQWGDEHNIEIDEYSIDRVEIIKGPGSLLHGSDGIGGVVNFLSPKPVQNGEIKGTVLTNYQTNQHLTGYSFMNTGNIKKIEWLGRISYKRAGNYSNAYDGIVYNSGYKEFDYNGYVGTTRKWGYSQIHFSSFSQKIAMMEGERDSSGNFTHPIAINDTTVKEVAVGKQELKGYKINVPYQFLRHNRIYWTNSLKFSNSSLRFTLGYQLNRRQEFGNFQNPEQYNLYFYLPTYTYNLTYFLPDWHEWKTTLGISGMFQSNKNKGIEFIIPEYSLFDKAGYILLTRKLNKLTVTGGLRLDHRTISVKNLYLDAKGNPSNDVNDFQKFTSFKNTYLNYSGSIGATYTITEKLSAKASISRGFRPPNIAELGSNGRHEGTLRYEYGNSSLKGETSLQLDAGINFISQHVKIEGNIFNNQIRNYIYSVKLQSRSGADSIVDASDPVAAYQYGQNNASLYGGEFIIDLHPHPFDWLHFENSLSIIKGKNLGKSDSAKYLPFIPSPRFQSKLRANIKKAGDLFSNCYVQLELDHSFQQNQFLKENHTETGTPAYTLLNSGIGGDVKNKKGAVVFSIYFTANNILNKTYQSHLSRLKYAPVNMASGRTGIFNMGRNFSIKLVVPITFKHVIKNNE